LFSKERLIHLKKNNIKKYLIYGFVEVILVVSGILIALQINNWDESRKQSTKNVELIDLLITDLDIKKNENQNDIQTGNAIEKGIIATLDYWKKNNDIDTTRIKNRINWIGADTYFFNNISPSYTRISNSPLWESLPDSLTRELNDIYYYRFTRIELVFENHRKYGTFTKLNYLLPNNLLNSGNSSKKIKKILQENPEMFIAHLNFTLNNIKNLIRAFTASRDNIEKVILKLRNHKKEINSNI
tara:strand:+ start:1508 stop:2236 length:729 start_codon:yes stop_codon:yes gene_type:complete